MRNKKEVTPFSIAFLDLLSSALAAVIILFVIVPKTDLQIDVFEDELKIFRGEMDLLDSLFAEISEELSPEGLMTWSSLISSLKQSGMELNNQMDQLTMRLEETKISNEALESRLESSEASLREALNENRKLRTQQASIQRKVAHAEQKEAEQEKKEPVKEESPVVERRTETPTPDPPQDPGIGNFLMGLNPEFAVMINWEDPNHSFDLYLKSGNRFTDNHNRTTPFGRWMRFPRRYNPNPHQVIMQNELVPGEYEIYVHLFRPRDISASFSGFIAFQPPKGRTRMIELTDIEIPSTPPPYRDGGGVLIGTLELTPERMTFNQVQK